MVSIIGEKKFDFWPILLIHWLIIFFSYDDHRSRSNWCFLPSIDYRYWSNRCFFDHRCPTMFLTYWTSRGESRLCGAPHHGPEACPTQVSCLWTYPRRYVKPCCRVFSYLSARIKPFLWSCVELLSERYHVRAPRIHILHHTYMFKNCYRDLSHFPWLSFKEPRQNGVSYFLTKRYPSIVNFFSGI
jgi:hypothetical protein